ncbi:malto-oligosyltrehalose synthase [Shinella curvata]|uniref:Malto-oligosyltrehalose synthase n=1 Tax=Shinella curvata TaxID=1817964 RepID=A0ABT8XHZ4_9HYPH|nr:malto-oligosyltrehalose synthase [Shinella curvata]MCJ8056059.1 malto-oligosyltrehalose synthase [Shinella curvata]MDO6123340.1 malto-oligosyltrehalose synthase [Shinella curvata]
MTSLHSTYRLQFRNGMDFARARQLVPYLKQLGISHLYASPLTTAVGGSTHGYDVIRADEIDPALGGLNGLRLLAKDLHMHGMGLLLDIVPNHMAASLENPWWRSVVTWGAESVFARHFDIDWSQKLTLPFLGKSFAAELADGTIRLAIDARHDALALAYHDTFYPLHPRTCEALLAEAGIFTGMPNPEEDPQGCAVHSAALSASGSRDALQKHLETLSADLERIIAIHAAQPWQLTDWKTASRHLSYRRFFEIAGLAGLRIEDPTVFDDYHRLILDLVHDGIIDGLRIDHIDGLADPAGYLERLRAAVGPDVYIVVEKILEKHEPFVPEWPVAGTTGYEFITALADAFADEQEGGRLADAFRPLKNEEHRGTYAEEAKAGKRQMLTDNFEGEVHRLATLASGMADLANADLSRSLLTEAVRAIIIALPVYRTYMTSAGVMERDRQRLATARQTAQESASPEVCEAIDFVWELLADDRVADTLKDCAEFRSRFQQVSGPIMAKALEDTLFYRENAFIALNEVGGDPGDVTGGPAAFHAAMQGRCETMPHGLSATSTHDTKRGEDARARLYTLSEAPERWIDAVERWAGLNSRFRRLHNGRVVPEPDVEWLIYQALAGIWPEYGNADIGRRMVPYMMKALREAKIRSNWSAPDAGYEQNVTDFVEDILGHSAFLNDFAETLSPFIEAGLANALAQTLVKLTAPGIPDFYQGSERGDFSLVDPDNRPLLNVAPLIVPAHPRPIRENFADYKQWLIATTLAARNDEPRPFRGPYRPLQLSDSSRQALAFLRGTPEAFAITVVPRLVFGKTRPDTLHLTEAALQNVSLAIPAGFAGRTVRSVLDDREIMLGNAIPLSELLCAEPVALLLSR